MSNHINYNIYWEEKEVYEATSSTCCRGRDCPPGDGDADFVPLAFSGEVRDIEGRGGEGFFFPFWRVEGHGGDCT